MIVRTPWSGQVVEVRVRLGSEVDEGESLVLIENKSMRESRKRSMHPWPGWSLKFMSKKGITSKLMTNWSPSRAMSLTRTPRSKVVKLGL